MSELKIEAVTKLKPASDAYTSNTPKNYGGGARLIPISLARVRWLERPEVQLKMGQPDPKVAAKAAS